MNIIAKNVWLKQLVLIKFFSEIELSKHDPYYKVDDEVDATATSVSIKNGQIVAIDGAAAKKKKKRTWWQKNRKNRS